MRCLLLLLEAVCTVALQAPLRAPPPGMMIFPSADVPAARKGEDRNIAMATLIAYLGDARTDDEAQALLNDATPMLMAPFIGLPDEGSIYEGCATLLEKADKYRTVIAERAKRARSTNNEAAARALERMGEHVVAQLTLLEQELADEDAAGAEDADGAEDGPDDAITRLRGGGRGGAPVDREWEQTVDDALDTAGRGISRLRAELRGRSGAGRVTLGDAAFAGFACGFAFGQFIVGDPMVLGLGLAGTCAFAHAQPENAPTRLARYAWRGGATVQRLRARL